MFEFKYLGSIDYSVAYDLQLKAFSEALNNQKYTILGLEHPAVLTLGYKASSDLEIFNTNTIKIQKVNRGGLATIHSEGQLVIYPVLNIRELKMGVRTYVQLLLRTTQRVLQNINIEAVVDEAAVGLYTSSGKIAFCGVQVKSGCTLHGLSLNISNDLNLFKNIRSCGIDSPQLDKVSNYNTQINSPTFFKMWSEEFLNNIN